jgi:hypothetical protein
MNEFTLAEQTVLYTIDSLRNDDHIITRAEIEAIADVATLQTLIDTLDVAFDEKGVLIYAPYPRLG